MKHLPILIEFGEYRIHGYELILIAFGEDGLPKLLKRHAIEGIKVFVCDLRPTIGESLSLPFRSDGNNAVPIIESHISAPNPVIGEFRIPLIRRFP